MVEFRDVVKKYTDPGEALGRDPDTGDVTGLVPGTDVDPVEVVTDPAAQAALSATFATRGMRGAAGSLFRLPSRGPVGTTAAISTDNQVIARLITDGPMSLDQIGVTVVSAASAGAGRLLIYDDDAGNPGALIRDCGTINLASATTQMVTLSPAVDVPTRWWAAIQVEGLTGSFTLRSIESSEPVILTNASDGGLSTNIPALYRNNATPGVPFSPLGRGNGTNTRGFLVIGRLATGIGV